MAIENSITSPPNEKKKEALYYSYSWASFIRF